MRGRSTAIITDPSHPVLRAVAAPVEAIDKDVRTVIHDLVSAARQSPTPAIGLAAPQIGVPLRVIVVKRNSYWTALVNPELADIFGAETEIAPEECLSVPGVKVRSCRYRSVVITGIDQKGRRVRERVHGHIARVYQHEIDHLDGVLIA